MRNLRVSSHVCHNLDLQSTAKSESRTLIRALAVDAQDSNVYAGTSFCSPSLVDLDLWQLTPRQRHLASFSAPQSRPATNRDAGHQIVALDHLSDGGSFVDNEPGLCIVCAGGDIALLALNGDNAAEEPVLPEIVGSVEQGILAAAWSPDEELLALVTAPTPAEMAEDKRSKGSTLLIMTRDFEVLSEEVLQTDDFGEERPITLGWGSKSTQFHGSEGKQAAAAAAAQPSLQGGQSSRGPLTTDDDLLPRISWRGDSNIFAVNSVEAVNAGSQHRLIRTFGKTGSLLATSDSSAKGVSHVLAFKPTGILMATTQRAEDGHGLAFFERNGLAKGEFPLRDVMARVMELAWNCDGTLLAIWLQGKIQIWTTGNYHWYLKQEIQVEAPVTCIRWHHEQPFRFYLSTTRSVYSRTFALDSCVSFSASPMDAACAAVVDGSTILLTPFRIQNVPPPMASMELKVPEGRVPVDMAWADVSSAGSSATILAILLHPGLVYTFLFEWGNLGGKSPLGGRSLPTPKLLCHFDFGLPARQVTVAACPSALAVQLAVGVLASEGFESLKIATGEVDLAETSLGKVSFESLALGKASKRVLVASPAQDDGELSRRIFVHEDGQLRNVVRENLALPAFFPQLAVVPGSVDKVQVVGLAEDGRLYLNEQMLAKDATSFALTDHNIVWTSAAHEARFLPLSSLDGSIPPTPEPVSLGRRVERGSRIVTAVPSTMSLVLQMPRGNLETIAPRPLVLEVIKREVDAKRYGSAYRICRTHRLDMNLLVDYNKPAFLANVALFVKQVRLADYLNLFLSSLRDEDVTRTIYKPLGGVQAVEEVGREREENKVNAICDSVRSVLEQSDDRTGYINTILTTYVRKSPPDYEASLGLLQRLKEEAPLEADEACKYIIFLTDADKLFDAALGMYDFTLPLLVAHHSPRKDPREYLPFLRELRDVEPMELQRFRIDETLGRWSKALGWIVKAGEAHFDQARRFIVAHDLYPDALQEYRATAKLGLVQDLYGDWLYGKHRFKEAGILFALCGKSAKAIEADVKAGSWKEAFEIAGAEHMQKPELMALAKRVAASLGSYGRNAEAARVAIDYLDDVEEAVSFLCKDLEYAEAKRLASLHHRVDLIQTHILPSLMENSEVLLEEIGEMDDQGDKQFTRLAELRKKKKESPEEYYPDVDAGGAAMDGDDGLSQAFTTFTRFTRFSAFTRGQNAPGSTMSAFTMKTNRTAKSKKKDIKKQQTGKKGSIYEEDYLFESVQKLLDAKLAKMQRDVGTVLLHFARLASPSGGGEKYRRRARELHDALAGFEERMTRQADVVWAATVREEEEMEVQRIKAIEEAIQLGISWAQLQANGLFAPQLQRKQIQLSKTDWQLDLLQHL